jgi:radical SAM protein with 4Fe4S-binding SPASM domain
MESLKYSVRPRTIFLEILYGCNLYCSYCYIGRQLNHIKPQVPPLDTTMNILKILKKENVEEIVLLGGEPMLHPHFTEICHTVAELGFPQRGIVTNGTVMTLEKALILKETGFWVDMSFRGPDADTFDDITGKAESFNKAFNAALLLSNLDMPLGMEFDCIPQNYARLYETILKLVNAGVRIKQLQLHRIMPEGEAEHDMEEFFLTLEQWRLVFKQAVDIRNELNIQVVFEDGFPFCLVSPEHWEMITPCPCGFTLLTVSPTGNVRYCPCHRENLGNVLHSSLASIWQQSLHTFRTPSRHHAVCLECDLFETCRGGCSASGHLPMDSAIDTFHEHFHPVKLNGKLKPEMKLILGQDLCIRF